MASARPVGQCRWNRGLLGYPRASLRMNPRHQSHGRCEIFRQITPVDGLMVRRPVPDHHKVREMSLHLATARTKITVSSWECPMKGRHPEARVIALCSEIAPEAEVELSDHLAVSSISTAEIGGALDRFGSVRAPTSVQRDDIQPCPQASCGGPCNKLSIQRVPDHNLRNGSGLHDCGGRCQVPLVQRQRAADVVAGARQVRVEPSHRQQVADRLRGPPGSSVDRSV